MPKRQKSWREPRDNKPQRITMECSICHKPVSFTTEETIKMPVICRDCATKDIKMERKKAQVKALNQGGKIWRQCKFCGKDFYITEAKAEHLKSIGLPLFDTCYECQQKAKQFNRGDK